MQERAVLFTDIYKPNSRPPRELADLVRQTAKLERYVVPYFPAGIFAGETVERHTRRIVVWWETLVCPQEIDKKRGTAMAWSHDLMELWNGDLPLALQLDNPSLASQKETEELVTAKIILPEEYFPLIEDFMAAGNFWKRKNDNGASPTAKAVKLVDWFDGNIIFHEKVAAFYTDGGVNDHELEMENSFRWTFEQAKIIREIAGGEAANLRELFMRLVDTQIHYVRRSWTMCPKRKIPVVMREYLA